MKRTILLAAAASALLASAGGAARATEVGYTRTFGLGVVVGDPTGLSAKLWVAPTNAIDFGFGFWAGGINEHCFTDNNGNTVCEGFGDHNGTVNVDYLWQSNIVRGAAQLDWHVGGGGRANWWGGNCASGCFGLAARAPIGLDLMFNNPSFIEVFLEIAPAFEILPSVWFDIEGGLGGRFYF